MDPLKQEELYRQLAAKWLDGSITPAEQQEFANWYNSGQDDIIEMAANFTAGDEQLKARMMAVINRETTPGKLIYFSSITKWAFVAAAILLLCWCGWYFSRSMSTPARQVVAKAKKVIPVLRPVDREKAISRKKSVTVVPDIVAGTNKAVLTLGDGTRIILDDAQNGILASQGDNNIRKTADGEIIYTFSSRHKNSTWRNREDTSFIADREPVAYNTIETPKGGKFQIKLPDGSSVWLNAASSLRFPANFGGSKRMVTLTGEAYFEVAHDSTRNFEVTTRNQKVQVLGTHFNINAYADEPSVNTTLLQGNVLISDVRTNHSQLLKPGEQSKLAETIEVVNVPDAGRQVAWKDGYFQFSQSDIQTVMRQIERWYDVTIRYEGTVPAFRFGGEIERNLSLLQVLKILEKTKVHFRLEDREVIVMP